MNRGFTFIKRQAGFTLIELLVVFSVIAILSAIGIAAFVSYSRSQQVVQTANNLKLLISQARFNALSVVKTNRDSSGTTISCGVEALSGYSVGVIGGDSLELTQECANSSTQRIKLIELPTGLGFGTGTSCDRIHFSSLSSSASGVPCDLVVEGFGQTKTISIDAIGNTTLQ